MIRYGRAPALAVAALVLAGPVPVPASADDAAAGPRAITLAGQPAWAGPDGDATLVLAVPGPGEGLVVTVTAFRAATSRSQLTRALTGKTLGAVEGRHSVPLDSLLADGAGNRLLPLGIRGPASLPAPNRIVPGESGVYPLLVELHRAEGAPLGRFVTPLAVISSGLVPVTLAWVWRLDATPGRGSDGRLRTAATRAFAPDGRLAHLVDALGRLPDVPLTLAPTPETLETWVAARDTGAADGVLDRLRAEVARPNRQLLDGPYVPVDMAALQAAGMAGEVDAQFQRGAEALSAGLGAAPPPTTLLARQLDESVLGRLRQRGVERLVVAPADLEPMEQRLTPGRPFTVLGERGRGFPTAVTDPGLADLLGGSDAPALRAARFLGELTLVAMEDPGARRGVVVVTPPNWDPPPELLEAVLAGLRGHPAVVPDTLDGFFAGVPPEAGNGGPLTRVLRRSTREAPVDPGAVRSVRRRLAAFTDLVGGSDPTHRLAERAVLLSQFAPSDSPAPSRSAARAWLTGAERLVTGFTGRVHGPEGRVTLTARRASIPITVLNANPRPLQVRIRLESDQVRFPEGSERVLTLPPRNTTSSFAVETRSPGAFPLLITITSPNGQLLVSRTRLTVRSTVVSGMGAFLTVGAGAFLLAWWGNDLRRARRRAKQLGRRQAKRRRLARRRRLRVPRAGLPVEAKLP